MLYRVSEEMSPVSPSHLLHSAASDALRLPAIKPWELPAPYSLLSHFMGCVRLAALAWDWAPKRARRGKVPVGGEGCQHPHARRLASMVFFLCELKRGVLGSWFRLGKNSWHGRNRAGNGKRCREVTNRKR